MTHYQNKNIRQPRYKHVSEQQQQQTLIQSKQGQVMHQHYARSCIYISVLHVSVDFFLTPVVRQGQAGSQQQLQVPSTFVLLPSWLLMSQQKAQCISATGLFGPLYIPVCCYIAEQNLLFHPVTGPVLPIILSRQAPDRVST